MDHVGLIEIASGCALIVVMVGALIVDERIYRRSLNAEIDRRVRLEKIQMLKAQARKAAAERPLWDTERMGYKLPLPPGTWPAYSPPPSSTPTPTFAEYFRQFGLAFGEALGSLGITLHEAIANMYTNIDNATEAALVMKELPPISSASEDDSGA